MQRMHAPELQIMTVSELTRRVKDILEAEVGNVWVSGEISNYRVSPAGHAYFTLKDERSQIDAVMFRNRLMRLRFKPDTGIEAIAFGLVTVYEKRGNYQIICEELHPKGLGALQLAFEKLKQKLDAEGLFETAHKKTLPVLPRRIGIVTSPTGAAIRDILNVINRRFANVHILLYPARVQGDEAAAEIVEGIQILDKLGVDVMIVGRGGGSLEDLWPFNEETVVRAVYEAETPIISAVGHEIDFALCDFAADVRAPTPSAAAELVVREREVLLKTVTDVAQRLARAMDGIISRRRHRLDLARSSYFFRKPEELVRQQRQRVDDLRMRIEQLIRSQAAQAQTRLLHAAHSLALMNPRNQVRAAVEHLEALKQRLVKAGPAAIERFRARLRPVTTHLNTLSPLAILGRGYSLTWELQKRALVRDSAQLQRGGHVFIQFGKGTATAQVLDVEEDAHGGIGL
jgi:exodeoxyribonuclease VII large subunit